jgi:crotonobetainyl-CoA:carnitine CoA-transferase CaiB-like acyl-CoA transferase
MDSPGALHGVRVLDLADESGALCGKLLADMGADVILVEPPGGAPMRRLGPFCRADDGPTADDDRSLFFWHYNTNKRSVTLDLAVRGDRERLLHLVASADILIETTPPGALDAVALGYRTLRARNPQLTLISITPFGQTGPYCNFRGSDLIGQAMGGMVFVNGVPGAPPLPGLGLQAYHSAATYAAIGALLALLARQRSGRGQWIDVSIQECVAAAVEHASSFFHQDGSIAERQGSLHWTRYFRVGTCRDGYVMHCTLGDWTSLLEWVKADGKAQDLADLAWDDATYRRDHCVHLFDVLDEWARTLSVSELVDGAQLRRLPYAAVVSPEALADNPQLAARGFFVPVHHDELGTLTYPGAPYVFSRTPWRIRRRPPRLGEHQTEVFAEVETPSPSHPALDTPHSGLRTQHSGLPTGRALDGVRVIDFTWVVAGPVATRILADHGAEIIKVERHNATDFGSRRGGLTGNLNRGKQSLVLNMSTPRGIELARQLIATADVVIDNFSARVMPNWELDYAHLRRIKSDIIALSMSGFGHTGPWQDHVSYGPTLQALAGYTFGRRYPGGAPVGWGFSYSDMAAGCSGALAVLIALWHRRRTGEGQFVDLSQFENLVSLIGPSLLEILLPNALKTPSAGAPDAGPVGVYRCADLPGDGPARDRWCAIELSGDAAWRRFAAAIGDPPWTRDVGYATAAARRENRQALDRLVESWTRSRTAEAVMIQLQRAGVAAGVVANAEDLCRRDPHLQARGYWTRVATPEGDSVECDGVPFKMSETPGSIAAPGPLLGEHTDAVLQRVLDLTPETIAALRAQRIVA